MFKSYHNTLPTSSDILRPKGRKLDTTYVKHSLQSVKEKQKKKGFGQEMQKQAGAVAALSNRPARIMPQQGKKEWIPRVIVRHCEAPRSNMVQVGYRQLRPNSKQGRSSTHKAK